MSAPCSGIGRLLKFTESRSTAVGDVTYETSRDGAGLGGIPRQAVIADSMMTQTVTIPLVVRMTEATCTFGVSSSGIAGRNSAK